MLKRVGFLVAVLSATVLGFRLTNVTNMPATEAVAALPDRAVVVEQMTAMPLAFTENRGQWDERVLFRTSAGGATVWLCRDGIYYQFVHRVPSADREQDDLMSVSPGRVPLPRGDESDSVEIVVVKAAFEDANQSVEVIGEELLEYRCNYFLGSDPSQWRTDVPNYAGVVYRDVYPGINAHFEGQGGLFQTRWEAKSGADLSRVQFRYDGNAAVTLTHAGELLIEAPWGTLMQAAFRRGGPRDDGFVTALHRTGVSTYGMPTAGTSDVTQGSSGAVSLVYSTFLGGSNYDVGYDIAVNASGSAYVTGTTYSTNFPTENPYDGSHNGGDWDVFVTKLAAAGNALVYSTFIGGASPENGLGIAVDQNGSAYVTGSTNSANFPTQNPYDGSYNGVDDAYVTKLAAAGNALVYSTFLGGSSNDDGYGIAVDASGSAYVTGRTYSTDFPTQNPYDGSPNGEADVFVTKLSAAGDALVYSTFLGGSSDDYGRSIAVDAAGSAYVTGTTFYTDFPTQNPYDGSYNGGLDVFVTKLAAAGDALVYSTFLGGGNSEVGWGIAVDAAGGAYVTGHTYSWDFPTQNPYDGSHNGGYTDVFMTKLAAAGNALVYSTFLGGSANEIGEDIAVDASGSAYVTGYTQSFDFPTKNPYDGSHNGGDEDVFVTKLAAAGNALVYSTFLGGNSYDYSWGIAVDASGGTYVTGQTGSSNFPTQNPYDGSFNGNYDVFLAKISWDYDVMPLYIVSPRDSVPTGSSVTPRAVVKNVGIQPATFPVVFQIASFYADTVDVNALPPGDTAVVTFADWLADPAGTYTPTCYTDLAGDEFRGNDTSRGFFLIRQLGPAPELHSIVPDFAGNTGVRIVQISGVGFSEGVQAKLIGPGLAEVQADTVYTFFQDSTLFETVFDLTGWPVGTWNLEVWNPDGSPATFYDAFRVDPGSSAIWMDIVGRDVIRLGREEIYTVTIENWGNIDYLGMIVTVDSVDTADFDFLLPDPEIDTSGLARAPNQSGIAKATQVIVGFLKAGKTRVFRLKLGGRVLGKSVLGQIMIKDYANYLKEVIKYELGQWNQQYTDEQLGWGGRRLEYIIGHHELFRDFAFKITRDVWQKGCEYSIKLIWGGALCDQVDPVGWVNPLAERLADVVWATPQSSYKPTLVVNSSDPNDKAGPQGWNPEWRYLADESQLHYTVYFENVDSATAPAESIWVADTLDPDLDWSTLQLGETFPGVGPDSIRPDYTSVTDFNPNTGVITWGLYGINLPPDTAPYWGEGWVNYSVRPKANLPTGTRIENIAAIKFDVNPWILAPMDSLPVFNTIDAGVPSSAALPLPDTVPVRLFLICWDATDDSAGSGINSVQIYFSENGKPYLFWGSSESPGCSTFVGNWGSIYQFYTIARDGVGHVEATPQSADAITVVPPCDCLCHADPQCDGVTDVLDVTQTVGVAFRGQSPMIDPLCPRERSDVNCDGVTDVLDVVGMVAVAFRGGDPATAFCDPCA